MPEFVPAMPANRGWRAAYAVSPGQTAPNPETDGWTAHSSFTDGAGPDSLYAGNEASSNVVRVTVEGAEATITLDPATFPEGRWQIEIRRGLCYRVADFTFSSYDYDGDTIDFFSYVESGGNYQLARSREALSDACYLVRCCSVVNSHPVNDGKPVPNCAFIALKAYGRSVSSFKIRASSIVDRWGGTAFDDFGESARPADHFHNVLRGPLASLPLPDALIDKASLSAWHAANVSEDRRCDMIVEGGLVGDILANIAGCAFAKVAASEVWGVMRDYDRSEEDPVQTFTIRNSSGLAMTKAFTPRLPDMLRCVYSDMENRPREVEIWRPGREGTLRPVVETVNMVGLTRDADVIERGTHDLRQMELRAAVYDFNAFAETIRCRRGDLIAVNHHVLDRTHDSGRIRAVTLAKDGEADMLTELILDAKVRVYNEPDMHEATDMHAVADMHSVGLKSGVMIRRSDETMTVHPVSNATGTSDTLTLTTPVELPAEGDGRRAVRNGNLVSIGATGREARRLIATDIQYEKGWKAKITALAEAPELHA